MIFKTGNIIILVSLAFVFLLTQYEEAIRRFGPPPDDHAIEFGPRCKKPGCINPNTRNKGFTRINYIYFPKNKKLVVNHINAGFNCCPGRIHTNSRSYNDTIQIYEYEEEEACKCLCLYDLEIIVEEVESQKYILDFTEPYINESMKIHLPVDLALSDTGSITILRNTYPWN